MMASLVHPEDEACESQWQLATDFLRKTKEGSNPIDEASPEGRPHQCQGEKALRDAVPNLNDHSEKQVWYQS